MASCFFARQRTDAANHKAHIGRFFNQPGTTMLRSTQEMKNYAIGATDGEIGHVVDLLQQTVKDSPRFESSAVRAD